MGILMGRQFNLSDLGLLAVFSVGASFATIGVSGLAALAPLAIVLRPFGLSYEVAVPLMIIIDPLADMVRTMLNVAINCVIPTLAGGRAATHDEVVAIVGTAILISLSGMVEIPRLQPKRRFVMPALTSPR